MSIQRPPNRPGKQPRKRTSWLKVTLLTLLGCGVVAAAGLGVWAYTLTRDLPDVKSITFSQSSVIYDVKGRVIRQLADVENRTTVSIKQVPEHVQNAFIAIEDHSYYSHHGISPWGLVRAGLSTGMHYMHIGNAEVQGASTITQQLAKNAFTHSEFSVARKIREAALAIELERTYTKPEILEKYLNQNFFGHHAYGIQAAAQVYFRKDASKLDLAEGALLAGVINGPSLYDPYDTTIKPGQPITPSKRSLDRQREVLDAMERYQLASPAEVAKARSEQLVLAGIPENAKATYVGGWYTDYVIDLLTNANQTDRAKYNLPVIEEQKLYSGGYKIYTNMDLDIQAAAEKTVRDRMAQYDQEFGFTKSAEKPESAAVVLNHKTGAVLALVGGRDHSRERILNRATDTYRQPGSSIKPIGPYLAGIQSGMGPGSIVDDAPFQRNAAGRIYPENYDFVFNGLIPLRYALKQSVNTVAYKLALKVSPAKILHNLKDLGITSLVESGASNDNQPAAMALGGLTKGVSVLEMASAYGVLGNGGIRVDPIVIREIRDANNQVVWQAKLTEKQVVNPVHAWLVDSMLQSVMEESDGFGRQAFRGWPQSNPLNRHAGGKTGTTEGNTDAWFVGMTANLAAGVWTGFDHPEHRLPEEWVGAFQPSGIWNEIMVAATKNYPDAEFPKPKTGLTQVLIDRKSGKIPSVSSPPGERYLEWFATGTEPKPSNPGDFDDIHKPVQVCTENKKLVLWRQGCSQTPETRIFLVRPDKWSEVAKDPSRAPKDANLEPPGTYCAAGAAPSQPGDFTPNPNGVPLWPSPGPGTNPGTGPGTGPGTNPGTGPGTGPTTGPGTGPGTAPGTGPGTAPGTGPGAGSGTGGGTAPGTGGGTGAPGGPPNAGH